MVQIYRGVYALPREAQPGQLRFENLLLADSPLVVCSLDVVELAGKKIRPVPNRGRCCRP